MIGLYCCTVHGKYGKDFMIRDFLVPRMRINCKTISICHTVLSQNYCAAFKELHTCPYHPNANMTMDTDFTNWK